MMDQNKIKELVKKYTEDMRRARRRLHEYPEISNEEERTAAYMAPEVARGDVYDSRVDLLITEQESLSL